MNALALPTQHDEAWRYADTDAVARLWPFPAPERIVVAADAPFARTIVATGGVVQLDLELAADARAAVTLLNAAEDYSRIEISAVLHEGADFSLNAVQIGGGEATLEIVTALTHAAPDATSAQTVRMVAGGNATCTFLGKIIVAKDAQHTDAAQSVKAMLLSDTATANAVPQLEIDADDVKCAHGCAIGQLDEAALFYATARGLDPASARQMLLEAFVAEVFAEDATLLTQARDALGRLG